VRPRLIDSALSLVRRIVGRPGATSSRASSKLSAPVLHRHDVAPPSVDAIDDASHIEYSPCLDGDPDPGEVVWTWVPFQEDPSHGKDRPVVIVGRRGRHLLGIALTSKQHDNEAQVEVGRGPWDHEGRVSYAKVERLLDVDPAEVRREGAVLERQHFDHVVAGMRRAHRSR
jgi:PemK-like, MazF-like toxin of type II toxin-antitoxin system